MIRLVAYAATNWDHLVAAHPAVDLVQMPFHRLLSILYVAYAHTWAAAQIESRPQGSPPPDWVEFDFMLEAPLPGRTPTREVRGKSFIGDYRSAMGQ